MLFSMRKLSFNLTPRHRLDLRLVKKRQRDSIGGTLFPSFEELRRVRRGNKISRFFRHIFEHKNIRKILGTNLAFVLLVSSFVPTKAAVENNEIEQVIISVNKTPLITEHSLRYPVEKVIITQGYHFFHPGIDLDGRTGDNIYAIEKGVVQEIQYSRFAYGNSVILNHGNGITSLYAHLSKIDVLKNQKVSTSTKIGEMGASGYAFGDHLHLEIRQGGHPMNPLSVLPRP